MFHGSPPTALNTVILCTTQAECGSAVTSTSSTAFCLRSIWRRRESLVAPNCPWEGSPGRAPSRAPTRARSSSWCVRSRTGTEPNIRWFDRYLDTLTLQSNSHVVSSQTHVVYSFSVFHMLNCSKTSEFLAGRSQFDTDHRFDFYAHTCCQSATFGPLLAFYCPLFFTDFFLTMSQFATDAIFTLQFSRRCRHHLD